MALVEPQQEEQLFGHSKPMPERRMTYFCKLCRKRHIKNRNAHLKNHHKADQHFFEKRKDETLLDAIFLESY